MNVNTPWDHIESFEDFTTTYTMFVKAPALVIEQEYEKWVSRRHEMIKSDQFFCPTDKHVTAEIIPPQALTGVIRPSFESSAQFLLTPFGNGFLLKVQTDDALYEQNLDGTTGEVVYNLFSAVMDNAWKVPKSYATLDGTCFYLSRRINEQLQTFFQHNPTPDSPMGIVRNLMKVVISFGKTGDSQILNSIPFMAAKVIPAIKPSL